MRVLKLLLVGALILGVFLVGQSGNRGRVLAQDTAGQTYVALAGTSSGNVAVDMFAPSTLQVHQGDTVRWLMGGFHNIHFGEANATLLLPFEQDGKSILQMNPAVAMPTIQSGGSYTGGEANNGMPFGGPPPPYFELKIDAAPGSYQYFCDIHAGMTGVIEVVDSATSVPSPVEAITAGFSELSAAVSAGMGAQQTAKAAAGAQTDDGATISVGTRAGQANVFGFFPAYVEINAGQSVTWSVAPDGVFTPTGIGSLPLPTPDQMFGMIPSEAGPPTIFIPDVGANGSVASGSTVGAGDSWYSGILYPGESYTLTFSEPGVYRFGDGGTGHEGVIVVK